MNTYTVTYDDGQTKQSGLFPRPGRLAQPGDVYGASQWFTTLAGSVYGHNDTFEIIERTEQAPHNRTSSVGNLLIRCKDRVSVWTNFDAMIASGSVSLDFSL